VVPSGASLFERLEREDAGAPSAVQATQGHAALVASIKRHLVRLLNTHPGNSQSAPALGLMDFNDATLGTQELNLRICSAIRQCIMGYEPRVRRVDVATQPTGPDPLQLRFQVTVHLPPTAGDGHSTTTIDLLLDDRRYYRVVQ